MIKSILALTIMFAGFSAHSFDGSLGLDLLKAQGLFKVEKVKPMMLEWTVGDNAQYNLDMGFIKGTMNSYVREETSQGFWMNQDMDLGFMGEQKVEVHINKNTGEIIELLVNGQKQTPPDQSQSEVVDMQESSITVPAGTFDCVYLKIRDNGTNQETEVWLNPTVVPMSGMLKTIAPGQMGPVTLEMTGYEKK